MNKEQYSHILTVHARAMAGALAITFVVVGESCTSAHCFDHDVDLQAHIGIQIFMVTYGIAVFLETPRPERKGRRRYMVISLLLFIIPTLGAMTMFYRYFTMWWDAQSAIDYGRRRGWQLLWASMINDVTLNFSISLGDALLLYRCYIVWADKKWVIVVPALTYAASVGASSLRSLCHV